MYLYLCPSFTCKPQDQFPPNIVQTFQPQIEHKYGPANLTLPSRGTPSSKTLADLGKKTLCDVKCLDGYPYTVMSKQNLSPAAPGPGWLVICNKGKLLGDVCNLSIHLAIPMRAVFI